MPADFMLTADLLAAAERHKFRLPNVGEPEIDYRRALAYHVRALDLIEAHEIRLGKGWDLWTEEEQRSLLHW